MKEDCCGFVGWWFFVDCRDLLAYLVIGKKERLGSIPRSRFVLQVFPVTNHLRSSFIRSPVLGAPPTMFWMVSLISHLIEMTCHTLDDNRKDG